MDKQRAQVIVKETFETPFDKGRFTSFVKELLNSIEDAPFSYKGNFIPDAYEQYISSLERIGKYTDGEHKIDILVVKLKKKTSIERARTMQRNFIAWYLNGSRGGEMKDAALVAFVSPDGDDWRFSLVKMDYRFEEGKGGRVKVKEEFTPARRWSFLVGKNENCHTAQSKLYPIIADDKNNPTLAELEEAFNIEKVTKEFFEKYRDLFLRTKEMLDEVVSRDANIKADFEAKGVNTVDFAKKLLGQIVFLYFLQKKGWFGVARNKNWGEGDKQFLRSLFEKAKKENKNYFNNFLEPLFYEALRNDRSHEDHYFSMLDCKIPFLNGGLFDPMDGYDWKGTDIKLQNELFSNDFKTKEGDTGNGILDIFDRYNFTVKEDEPLEKEVAVDPEMLGKAYEKFNAIRPDNYDEYKKALKGGKKGGENKFNKQYGVYYTPREIVHYMCQQSLINYLYTALNDVPVSYEKLGEEQTFIFKDASKKPQLDLTIEHRPCPVISKEDIETLIKYGEQLGENEATVEAKGKETKTYFYKLPESIRQNAKPIDKKLSDIKVCDPAIGSGAFPVGMMSEIVKTRQTLTNYFPTLEKGGKGGFSHDRTPYNFKRECIEKSLYGVDIDPGAVEIAKLRLWLSLVVDEDDIKQIKPLPNLDYKIVCGNSLIGVEKNLFNDVLFKELERIKPLLFNETSPKKKQEYKNQIDDLISQITNGHKEFDFEVYFSEVFHEKKGFDVVIGNPPYLNFKSYPSEDREAYKQLYREVFNGKADVYYYFIFKGMALANPNGFLSFITSRYWIEAEFAAKLRQYISENYEIREILDFSNAVIFEQGIKVAITSIAKRRISDHTLRFMSYVGKKFVGLQNDKLEISLVRDSTLLSSDNRWIFVESSGSDLLAKISKNSVPLDDIAFCKQGIVTGRDRAFIFEAKAPLSELKNSLIKPWLKVGDVHRYSILPVKRRFLVYTNDIDEISNYPSFHDWLRTHSEKLKTRREVRNGKIRWFDLQWPREKRFFDNEKLICRFKAERNTFAYDDYGFYCSADITLVLIKEEFRTKYSIKYVLALLNSRLSEYHFRTYAKLMDYRYEYYPTPVSLLRICPANPPQQKPFITLVDQILTAKKKDLNTDTSALEKQIDEMVYALYGLTPEEIAIVEGKKENADK